MNYKRPTEWENYGDVNPDKHGGNFIKWENGKWRVIITEYGYLEEIHFYPEDVFENENPKEGFTEMFKESFREVYNNPFRIEDLGLENSLEEDMKWVIENHMNRIAQEIAHMNRMANFNSRTERIEGDYWEHMEKYGITEENA